ncbi:type II secretion system F family protein [Marinobacter halodurans]|uniref:Type II secretion system F family protein n=1 Tax=Marinobacter halodurans TaxID=2528979 RepID=A0ABY1ZIA0_9GAMM|nr:type II secretion system F family protein [Marinobacter halodurans]TBW54336.1 type II secretion system F family protein [Marinobacter halodurans]
MDYLIGLLDSTLQDKQAAGWIFVALMGITVFCVGLAMVFLVSNIFNPVRNRLKSVVGSGQEDEASNPGSVVMLAGKLAPFVLPRKEGERGRTRERLMHAGFRGDNALATFYAIKTLLIIGLPLLVLLIVNWIPSLTSAQTLQAGAVAVLIGVGAPNYVLGKLIQRRKRLLYNGFPDALDLLVVCTEAGFGLKPALQRVADEISVGHPELAQEFALVNAEMRAGVDRADALHNLADRTGLDEIAGLVTLLSQSLRFGNSIADSLRIYSEEFRDKRMQKAEEEAGKISTKLIFPLVLCMFPAFFVVAIGPAVIGLLDHFKG